MSKFKVLALAATLIMATAGLAIAGGDCGSKASAETASASGCSSAATAQTASASGCSSAATAQTASASGCSSAATAKTASAEGCSSAATVQTAGAACSAAAGAHGECAPGVSAKTVKLETVRMPSGAMAVFYSGTTPETIAFLQSKAAEGCSGFVCDMAKSMAADESVATEIAATEHGVMILVTAKDGASVDKYEEQYASVVKSMHEGE